MDSPFINQGASIEGENSKILKDGHTITFTCRLSGINKENDAQRNIEWLKNGVPLNLIVRHQNYTNKFLNVNIKNKNRHATKDRLQ